MDFSFDEEDLKSTSTNRFVALVPPTETLEDGSLEITGFVTGLQITGYKYDEQNNQAIYTLSNEEGESIPKYYKEPATRSDIVKYYNEGEDGNEESKALAKKRLGGEYKRLLSVFKKFVKEPVVLEAAKVKPFTLQSFSDAIFEKMKDKTNLRNTDNVEVKIVFQKSTGEKPKYKIPKDNWIGNTTDSGDFKLKFETDKGDWSDIKNFAFVEATDTFAASAPLDLPFGDIDLG